MSKKNCVMARSRAGIELGLEIVQVELRRSAPPDAPPDRPPPRSRNPPTLAQAAHQIRPHRQSRPDAADSRRCPAAHRRAAPRCGARRRASSRARSPARARDRVPTQVRCGAGVSGVSCSTRDHHAVRALAGRAVSAVGHRHEARPQRRQPLDRLPQRLLHLLIAGRKELERHLHRPAAQRARAAVPIRQP